VVPRNAAFILELDALEILQRALPSTRFLLLLPGPFPWPVLLARPGCLRRRLPLLLPRGLPAQRRPPARRGACLDRALVIQALLSLRLGGHHALAIAAAAGEIGGRSGAGGVAGSALVAEQGLQPGTDVGGVWIDGFGSFAGALWGVMNVSLSSHGEHVLRGGGGWGGASIGVGCGQCVRTVESKIVFAEGPNIAAAMRDMLATTHSGFVARLFVVAQDRVLDAPQGSEGVGKEGSSSRPRPQQPQTR
jgi:hypothetical protein